MSGVGGIKLLGVPALQHRTDVTDMLTGPKIADAANRTSRDVGLQKQCAVNGF